MPIKVFKNAVPKVKHFVPVANPTVRSLVGKTVLFQTDKGDKVAGRVESKRNDGRFDVSLALPNDEGLLMVTDTCVAVDEKDLTPYEGVASSVKVRRFESTAVLAKDNVKMQVVRGKVYDDEEDDERPRIKDYLNVSFEGYASTFENVTPADRQGDGIVDGAFTKTINKFMSNPVMLIDHESSVGKIAGSYSELREDKNGLWVVGKISNAPSLRDVRFLVAEGHLRALSIGGMFFYDDSGRRIKDVELFEISLVAVPANQDALFDVRKISIDDAAKAYKTFRSKRFLTKPQGE